MWQIQSKSLLGKLGFFSYFTDKIKSPTTLLDENSGSKICKRQIVAQLRRFSRERIFPNSPTVHFCSTLTSEPGGEIFCKSQLSQISIRRPCLLLKISFWCKYEYCHMQNSMNSYDFLLTTRNITEEISLLMFWKEMGSGMFESEHVMPQSTAP